jgi:predicted dehydrogenase/threonine dehydrogenase-like Zn-dependent dehydrogenase
MLQLTQNLKTGKMELTEVPFPAMGKEEILVRNYYSLISSGTESYKVETARKSLIGKAKEKPEQVKQVLDTFKKEGLVNTYNKVMNKLDALSALGYSSAGEVIEVGQYVTKFKVGDRVACGGQDIANHAEVISVPENLSVKIPDNVSFEDAAYTTIASIALQGIRQADLRLGESCAVIGLGLVGQLTAQLLNAAGIKTAGIDVNQIMVDMSCKSGCNIAFNRADSQLDQSIINFSDGFGVDAVIITAGTSSLDPIELAGKLCRQKGKVIVVGAVPTGFSRENYYKKELDLRMSCSYGPGRYNSNYEDKGLDFPIGYVRWTENRNMHAFLELLSQGKVNLKLLTTHVFNFDEALKAYDLILQKDETFIGVLLKYNPKNELKRTVILDHKKYKPDDVNISFIGAGSFAQNSLLPHLKNINLISVATSSSNTSKSVAGKFGFAASNNNADEIINSKENNTLFIVTRHNFHAEFVLQGIKNNKNIFVEKPLCLTEAELEEINSEYHKHNIHLMVGYNRRFAPLVQKIKKLYNEGQPIAINYRINAGFIPQNNWVQEKEIGGGRIIGEVCHFVDLAMYLAGALPESLSAFSMDDPAGLLDTITINLRFKNGSIACISYLANGSKELKKEYLEVFSSGVSVILDDFKKLTIFGKNKRSEKLLNQNKGHKEEVNKFISAIKEGKPTPIPFEEIYYSTKMSFDIIKSIQNKKTISY